MPASSPSHTRITAALLLLAPLGCAAPSPGPPVAETAAGTTVWVLDRVDALGSHRTRVLGSPTVVEAPRGPAIRFDGEDDALFVDVHPLAGAAELTAEVLFRPEPGGEREQRFLHLQEQGTKDRILFEIRVTSRDTWFLDTYIKSGGEGYTLFAKGFEHPFGEWYHVALVVEAGEMRHYVNGRLEITRAIEFAPQGPGRTSIGVRINEVSWFRGSIREARFTPRALTPSELTVERGARGDPSDPP